MKGLYNKYIITKTNGKPVDPQARYIVLRIDSGEYVNACRQGVKAFAEAVEPYNHELSFDLGMELLGYAQEDIYRKDMEKLKEKLIKSDFQK